jgi:hypothetical protein
MAIFNMAQHGSISMSSFLITPWMHQHVIQHTCWSGVRFFDNGMGASVCFHFSTRACFTSILSSTLAQAMFSMASTCMQASACYHFSFASLILDHLYKQTSSPLIPPMFTKTRASSLETSFIYVFTKRRASRSPPPHTHTYTHLNPLFVFGRGRWGT